MIEEWSAGLLVYLISQTGWARLRGIMIADWRRDGTQQAWRYF